MKKNTVSKNYIFEAFSIMNGAYAPLLGFARKDDYISILDRMRLADGSLWSIPVIMDISEKDRRLIND